MDSVTWEMRYGLPNQKYLSLIADCFPHIRNGDQVHDPLAPELPVSQISRAYVPRKQVEEALTCLDSYFLLGPRGSGKHTLVQQLPTLLASTGKKVLVARLMLDLQGVTLAAAGDAHDQPDPLAPESLVRHIFQAYWNEFRLSDGKRAVDLPQLRRSREWMDRLRWFYRRYTPVEPMLPGEFELMHWLRCGDAHGPFGPTIQPEVMLKELIRMIVAPVTGEHFGTSPGRPYDHVQVVIERLDCLAGESPLVALREIEHLHDLHIDCLGFTLVADSEMQSEIEQQLDCVKEGQMAIYRLPLWDKQDLYRVLHYRLNVWRDGEFAPEQYDWSNFISTDYLQTRARRLLSKIIVNGAQKARQDGDRTTLVDRQDVPLHLLRLARGLLAGCAGSWEVYGYTPPLDDCQLEKLVEAYWS